MSTDEVTTSLFIHVGQSSHEYFESNSEALTPLTNAGLLSKAIKPLENRKNNCGITVHGEGEDQKVIIRFLSPVDDNRDSGSGKGKQLKSFDHFRYIEGKWSEESKAKVNTAIIPSKYHPKKVVPPIAEDGTSQVEFNKALTELVLVTLAYAQSQAFADTSAEVAFKEGGLEEERLREMMLLNSDQLWWLVGSPNPVLQKIYSDAQARFECKLLHDQGHDEIEAIYLKKQESNEERSKRILFALALTTGTFSVAQGVDLVRSRGLNVVFTDYGIAGLVSFFLVYWAYKSRNGINYWRVRKD